MSEDRKSSLNPEYVAMLWCRKIDCSTTIWERQRLWNSGETGERPSFFKKMFLLLRSELQSMLPALLAVTLFGGMVLMFILILADVACLDAPNLTR